MENRTLYLFAIGGTGARVVKSLLFLLASGYELKNFRKVVPILIDPDNANGNLNETFTLIRLYEELYNRIENTPRIFFKQKVETLKSFNSGSQFRIPEERKIFRNFIKFGELNEQYNYFMRLLFSQSNLDSDLEVGFKGNPNMGTVVLHEYTNSEEYKEFSRSFQEGDAIFIISSIFGGTGASGFPTLLSYMRNIEEKVHIRNSIIGNITVQPYYQFEELSEDVEIKSETFLDKSRIAFNHYLKNIIEKSREKRFLDYMYIIGQDSNELPKFKYCIGGKEQKNPANAIELLSATAILDFSRLNDKDQAGCMVKSLSLPVDKNGIITLDSLKFGIDSTLRECLIKFQLLNIYLKENEFNKYINITRWTKTKYLLSFWGERPSILGEKFFYEDASFKKLKEFLKIYDEWLVELKKIKDNTWNTPCVILFNETESLLELEYTTNKNYKKTKQISTRKKLDILNNVNIQSSMRKNKEAKDNVEFRTFLYLMSKSINELFDKTIK